MAYQNPLIPTVDIQQQEQPRSDSSACLISFGTVLGTPPTGTTYANLFTLECILQDLNGAGVYEMTGTVANPAWTLISPGGAGDQTSIQPQDEGVNLGTSGTMDTLNFIGAGVNATRVGNNVSVTIPGSGGTSGGSAYDVLSASNFPMLAGSVLTITNAGTTIVSGNTGETTKAGVAAVYGSGSDTVGAAPYATAVINTASLYATLKALTGTAITTPATLETNNLSGLGAGVFAPGIYTTNSAIDMTAARTITLSGAGDYVFISKGGAITFGGTDVMVLTNGATSARVFWVANDAITTGTTDTLFGNFLSGVTGDITIGSTNIIEGRFLSSRAITVDGTASVFTLPAGTGGSLGSTVINGTLQVTGKVVGQLYENPTGASFTLLKMHNHSTTAGVGTMEAKGESVNDTGTFYGNYTNYDYTPTSASVAPTDIEGSLSNIRLTTGKTMTAGNLVGFTGQAINSGTLNGAGVVQAGVIGSLSGAGATTFANMAGVISSVGADVVNPTSGELSSFIADNLGTTVIDNLIKVVGNATTTNVFNFADTTGCAAGGSVATQSGASTGSLVIKIGSSTYKIPYFA